MRGACSCLKSKMNSKTLRSRERFVLQMCIRDIQCSMHYIRYDVLYAYVLSRLQYWSGLVQHDEERLLKRLLNANDKGQAAARKKQAAELNKAEKRKAEVDTLFARMYEDWACLLYTSRCV